MDYPEYGTDHERYLGSGIVLLSQIKQNPHPDPYHHLSPQCRRDRRELEQRFRHEVCKPWLKEYHLQAEVSSFVWEDIETEGWKMLEENKFPCLKLREDARICITGGIALLETARSSRAWGLAQTFDPLEPQQRWWVVDFFRDDGSHSKQAASRSQHVAVRGIMGAASQQAGVIQTSYTSPLPRYLDQDAHLASSAAGIQHAFHPLGQLPAIWTTKSFNYLSDIRKSWCIEEAINYVQAVVSQWKEITLDWNPTVVCSVDPESINMLQSRAPLLSKGDCDYIKEKFQQRQMLSQLTDSALREEVKRAVCRQGPILTMTTFAKDARLLVSRVHNALESVLGNMRSRRDDTLRKRVHMILGREYDALSCAHAPPSVQVERKKLFVERCYQHVFLHTMRTALPKGSISTIQLKRLAKREFDRLLGSTQEHITCGRDEDECEIAIETAADILPSYSDFEDVDVTKRHGVALFKNTAATSHLYSNQLHRQQFPRLSVSQAVMSKYITSIFLSGSKDDPKACSLPPASISVDVNPIEDMLDSLPFRSSASVSVCTADERNSLMELSSRAPSESDLDVESVKWRRPYIQTAAVISEAGSISDFKASPIRPLTVTQLARKRPLSLAASMDTAEDIIPISFPTPAKRPRDCNSLSGRSIRNVDSVRGPSSKQISQVSRQGVYAKSPGSSILSGVDYRHSSRDVDLPAGAPCSPGTVIMDSPSIYSPDRRSLTPQVMKAGCRRAAHPTEAYTELLPYHNPFLSNVDIFGHDRGSTEDSFTEEHNRRATQHYLAAPLGTAAPNSTVNAIHLRDTILQANPDAATTSNQQADNSLKPRPRYILYQSALKRGMFYRAPADERSTERFMQSQKRIDPQSTFWYLLERKDKKYAPTSQHLWHAIEKYGLDTVFVDSKQLGSTQYLAAVISTETS